MENKKPNILFIVFAYAFFWILILLTGLVMLWLGEGIHVQVMMVVCAWTPTFALLILFKKLYPGSSVKNFYINAFKERLNLWLLLCVTAIQLLIFIGGIGILSYTKDVSFSSLLDLSAQTIIIGFIMTLIQGATGEESGWRGFLQPSIEKNYGIIKTSLIVGIIWGFWHAPLWFLTSGYAGAELLQYIVSFMFLIVSTAVIIGICYSRCRNLFVPIWIHFMFNVVFVVFAGNERDLVNSFTYIAALYVLAAISYIVWYKIYSRKNKPTK